MEGAAEGSGNEDRICGLSLVAAIQSISLRELTKLYGPGVFFPLCMLYSKYFKVKCIVPKEKKNHKCYGCAGVKLHPWPPLRQKPASTKAFLLCEL